MFYNNLEYKKLDNESDMECIYRITGMKEQIGSWQDVANILNELLGTEYTESKFRKDRASFNKMFLANQSKFVTADSQIDDIKSQIRELERAKIQFRDERNAWQKQNYTASRCDETLNILEQELRTLGKSNFEIFERPIAMSNNELLVILSDLHIGQTFESIFGQYNIDIAKERLEQYLNEVVFIGLEHNIQKIHIVSLGDQISGNIHKTVQIANKENVIQQIKKSTEYISTFCYELSKRFESVFFYDVSGNHSRLDKKDDAVHDERLDDLIAWAVGLSLEHIDNFHIFNHRKLDSGIVDMNICGKTYIGVHGDYDGMTKTAAANLSMMLGYFPYAIVMGHKHFPAYSDISGIKMIQSGSLAGSGDSHTIESRLTGKPNQTVCVCNAKGIQCIYNVELD